MLELATKIEVSLQEYELKHAKDLLVSGVWLEVRNGVKRLTAELEVKGKQLSASRVDREYTQLTEALRHAVKQDNPPKIKEDFMLWDISQEFLCTLRGLSHFQSEINRQFSESNSEKTKSWHRPGPERVTLHQAKERVRILHQWADQKDINSDDRHSKVSLEEFAKIHSTTVTNINKYQSWYRKYRTRDELPKDPRKIPPGKLRQLFG